jgi:hypothetical protein
MDISPFSLFSYDDQESWDGFLLINAMAHDNYTAIMERLGRPPLGYAIADLGDTKEAAFDWLQTHYLLHIHLAAALNLPSIPDLSDVEFHDEDQFLGWLQMHEQQHQLIDAALGTH